jgi:hypothetical protein
MPENLGQAAKKRGRIRVRGGEGAARMALRFLRQRRQRSTWEQKNYAMRVLRF